MSKTTAPSGAETTHPQNIQHTAHSVIHERLFSPRLSGGAFKLYCTMTTYSDGCGTVPSVTRETFAQRMGKTTRTVAEYLRELQEFGAIEIIPEYDVNKRMGSSYRLLAGDRV